MVKVGELGLKVGEVSVGVRGNGTSIRCCSLCRAEHSLCSKCDLQ